MIIGDWGLGPIPILLLHFLIINTNYYKIDKNEGKEKGTFK